MAGDTSKQNSSPEEVGFSVSGDTTKLEIEIKPLSVNSAWKGRRYRSDEYERYRRDMFYLIPRPEEMYVVPLQVRIYMGLASHKSSDVDNPLKPMLDILGDIGYYRDDNLIYDLRVVKVPSKDPWVKVVISPLEYKNWLSKIKAEIKAIFG